jgi:hypothetical protein
VNRPHTRRDDIHLEARHYRTYVRDVGLRWSRKTFRDGWEGSDATGYSFAHVVPGWDGRWGAFVPCEACGYPDGLWLGGYETPDEAMDAAHRVVTAHVDAAGLPSVREALRKARLRGHR